MVEIEKNKEYAESNIAVVGITNVAYGRPQYILVNSDAGTNPLLKFPGSRYRAPLSKTETLENIAQARFEELTGLKVSKNLGIRFILPARSRNDKQWVFRNVCFVIVDDVHQYNQPDGTRKVYLADVGQGRKKKEEYVYELMNPRAKIPLHWVSYDNQIMARRVTDVVYNFDWQKGETDWYKRIPSVGATPLSDNAERPLGCGLAVASMMLLYQSNVDDSRKIILLQRKNDTYPGYGGGKIETLTTADSLNIDPISCCIEEGAQEYGFPIQPRALICCACTALDCPDPNTHYNSIITYAFIAEPTNLYKVEDALQNPKKYLEGKMESYVVETLDEHRGRIYREELRMPDMISVGKKFYETSPGSNIPLTQIISSGVK
ncbi:MAG: hypothetical protein AABX16_04315 [Nanoarchaeota archaeon]